MYIDHDHHSLVFLHLFSLRYLGISQCTFGPIDLSVLLLRAVPLFFQCRPETVPAACGRSSSRLVLASLVCSPDFGRVLCYRPASSLLSQRPISCILITLIYSGFAYCRYPRFLVLINACSSPTSSSTFSSRQLTTSVQRIYYCVSILVNVYMRRPPSSILPSVFSIVTIHDLCPRSKCI